MPARRRLARWRLAVRRPTGSLRRLPSLLVIGAQRCGTSSLYKYLGQHPGVAPSLRKEIEYFSTRYTEGVDWYRAHFAWRLGERLAFEASPDYLLHPLAATRAKQLLPQARVIVMLRNPVDRAFSQYQHNRRLGNEDLSFDAALAAEPRRIEGESERLLTDPHYRAMPLRRYGYCERGKYDEQLEAWLALYPSLHIVRSEDFFRAPGAVFEQVLDYLDLAPFEPADFRNYSIRQGSADPKDDPMSDEIRARLQEQFAPHCSRLTALVGVDFGWPMG